MTGRAGSQGRLVALGCARSAGVTTTATALARAWPEARPVLLAECDPAGGTLAASYGFPAEPGLGSLAAAARRRDEPDLVAEHCQALPGGALLLAGPPSAEQARAALAMLGGSLPSLAGIGRDTLIDCGRLDPASPVMGLFTEADLALIVCRPLLPDLHALAAWLEIHREALPHLAVVLTGAGPYRAAEVAEALGAEVLPGLPHDPRGVAQLGAGPGSPMRRSRSPLLRAAHALAGQVLNRLPPLPAAPQTESSSDTAVAAPSDALAVQQPGEAAAEPGPHRGAFAGQVER